MPALLEPDEPDPHHAGTAGFDLRNFECSNCDSFVTKTVELPRRAK